MPSNTKPTSPPPRSSGAGQSCRPRAILTAIGRAYPALWHGIDRLRAMRGNELPDWPDWCFLPLQGFYALLSGGGDRRIPPDRMHHLGIVGALATWRASQGIYRFDPEVAAAVAETPLDGDLPCAVLYHLPEWCVYIETPGRRFAGRELHGFWAYLDREVDGGADELRLVVDVADHPEQPLDLVSGLMPLVILLGEGSLTDALRRLKSSAQQRAQATGLAVLAPVHNQAALLASELAPLVALVLYLCAENAELGDGRRPARPAPTRTRHGPRLFPPDTPTTWEVGMRLGAALRQSSQPRDASDEETSSAVRAGPRPHIRRAHWHSYRIGKGRAELRVRWLAPIAVKVEDVEGLAAVVRPVT